MVVQRSRRNSSSLQVLASFSSHPSGIICPGAQVSPADFSLDVARVGLLGSRFPRKILREPVRRYERLRRRVLSQTLEQHNYSAGVVCLLICIGLTPYAGLVFLRTAKEAWSFLSVVSTRQANYRVGRRHSWTMSNSVNTMGLEDFTAYRHVSFLKDGTRRRFVLHTNRHSRCVIW